MKLIFLDTKTIGEDLSLSSFKSFGEVITYPFSTHEEALNRTSDADVVITNKVPINEETIGNASHLKLVCVTGTGTNHLDMDYLRERDITWRNVAGYSTDSVAQHTFAMLFYLLEKLRFYDDYVKEERYVDDLEFTHFAQNYHEISGMTWGIIGLGNIGRKVAAIAEAFGAKVIYTSPSGNPPQKGYTQVSLNTLLHASDIISVHAPLNEHTENLINAGTLHKMKKSCILLNLGRGSIINERDLYDALNGHIIAAAGLDVLCTEPMSKDNPLREIKDSQRLFITPHIGWAGVETRTRLMEIIKTQIEDFFSI
ncbi:D-2-hydroxyacid dehydrogenase [Lachnospiraceae bacterium 42-17]